MNDWQKCFPIYPSYGRKFWYCILFGYTDKKIGEMYGKSRTTANYWKIAALKQLRKEMERLEHEEQENDTF